MKRNNNKDDIDNKSKRKQKSQEYLKYQRYIKSKEFDEVRKAVFERDNYQCQFCNWTPDDYNPDVKSSKRTLTCHHRTYEHLYNEKEHLEDCITVCSVCHPNLHKAPSNFTRFKNKPK